MRELFLDDIIGGVAGRAIGIVSCFTETVAFGVKTIVDVIAQAISDGCQASGVVVTKSQRCRLRRPEGRGDRLDLAGGEIRPLGDTRTTTSNFR